MKISTVVAIMAILPFLTNAQDLRCVAESSYLKETIKGEKRIYEPISVCYYGQFFSFYTPETGIKSFMVSDVTTSVNNSGHVHESFFNAENETNMRGDYDVAIDYDIKKTIVINFTKSGVAFVVQSKGFLGDPEQNNSSKSLVRNIKHLKESKMPNIEAKPNLDLDKYVSNHLKWPDRHKNLGVISANFLVNSDGKIFSVTINETDSKLNVDSQLKSMLEGEIVICLENMPKWQAATDSVGDVKVSNVQIKINITSQ
jgi:hypothetical protein